ncbi:MAG: VanW family protein [Peptostreptococcaceae bacterium]
MKKKIKYLIILMSFVLLVFWGIKSTLEYFDETYVHNSKMGQNIYIENINISDITKEEVISILNEKIQVKDIVLNDKDKIYTIEASSIDLEYDTLSLIDKAYEYNKSDDIRQNIETFLELRDSKKEFNITPTYDEAKLSEEIERISNSINITEVDATIHISDYGAITRTPSRDGRELDIISLKEDIYNIIKAKNHTEITLNVMDLIPRVTTEDVNSVNMVIGEYSTTFSTANENRATNVEIAAKKTSDALIMPGEEFSYNDLTGKRIASNGYKNAPVIINGQLEDDVGGGVCQVSSTIFNTVMKAGLEVTSRRNHSLRVAYLPIGQDAMVVDNGSDFRFNNQYENPIYVKNTVVDGVLTSKIYGSLNDYKNIDIRVEPYLYEGLEAAKTYIDIKDASGNIIETRYIGNSVYNQPNTAT